MQRPYLLAPAWNQIVKVLPIEECNLYGDIWATKEPIEDVNPIDDDAEDNTQLDEMQTPNTGDKNTTSKNSKHSSKKKKRGRKNKSKK